MAFKRPRVSDSSVKKEVGKRRKQGPKGFFDTNSEQERAKRPHEIVDIMELTADYQQVRIMPTPLGVYSTMWIEIQVKGKDDKTRTVRIPKVTPNFDSETDSYDETIENPYDNISNDIQKSKHYYVNVIDRSKQENEPRKRGRPSEEERKSGFKESLESDAWTPVRVLRIPTSVTAQITKLAEMNKYRVKGRTRAFELSHPNLGKDILIAFDNNKAGTDKYDVQQAERTKLTDEERKYLVWDVSNLMEPESPETAAREAKLLEQRSPTSDMDVSDEFDDDDEDLLQSETESKLRRKRTAASERRPKQQGTKRPGVDDKRRRRDTAPKRNPERVTSRRQAQRRIRRETDAAIEGRKRRRTTRQ